MLTTIADRFRSQNWQRRSEIEDLLQECEILAADPIVAQSSMPSEPPPLERDGEHWRLFLDHVCNRGFDLDGQFVDRSEWLYEDCYLSDAHTRSGYWWLDRDSVPSLDVRFNH